MSDQVHGTCDQCQTPDTNLYRTVLVNGEREEVSSVCATCYSAWLGFGSVADAAQWARTVTCGTPGGTR